ncbi:WD40-like Beta Propeller Repeat [Catalinimonas alkaloidigena]|uniref:WD40-like Beta Propeller Repeat n=1 Tax=Catalinimonas alkaloidigena TaxID=1075417 RepID=A0A1G9DL54_9BACT|nr:OmpA family protein [Catalinimonas alkaloidigena]SDK64495.1 WD40-like Beta Propeller Repeat [Catalinimonas alkaloidigena]
MTRKFLLLCTLLLLASAVHAQEVQWASKVLDFSSELSPNEYSAKQALGKPNVLPAGGDGPNSWVAKNPDKDNFIKVGFSTPIKIQQIAVGEAFNPGAVYQVFTYDAQGKEYLINTFTPRPVTRSARMFNVFFNETEYEVAAVKITLDGEAVPGYNAIDAIGISNSRVPIDAEINILENINRDLVPERLSENVNSQYKELKPLLSPDGKTLFFSRQHHPENIGGVDDPEDIWYSELDANGEWGKAKNVGAPLNNGGPNFISSVTPDGNTMIVVLGNEYAKGDKMRAGVSISRKTADGWTKPENLKVENLYNFNDRANFYMSNSRKVLLMSIEREDSRGSRDLYVSFTKDDGSWTEPLNLGDDINTAGEESSPFLAADEKTLYFSSEGHSGYGGADIFVSRRIDETWQNWTEPENLGPEVNSLEDDIFFNIPINSDFAYYSRGVNENDADIYRLELPMIYQPAPVVVVKGKVLNVKTNEPIEANIIYEQLPEGKEVGAANSEPTTGEYQIALPYGATYGYLAEAPGYMSLSANIDLNSIKNEAGNEIEQNLYLVPVEKGATFTFNNIWFDFDKAVLKDMSMSELRRVTNFLNENPSVKIEISGHTDYIGSDAYNKALSQRRAEAVYSYLVKNGIAKDRLTAKGYGEERPTASNETEEGRAQNRRVEFSILEMENL